MANYVVFGTCLGKSALWLRRAPTHSIELQIISNQPKEEKRKQSEKLAAIYDVLSGARWRAKGCDQELALLLQLSFKNVGPIQKEEEK